MSKIEYIKKPQVKRMFNKVGQERVNNEVLNYICVNFHDKLVDYIDKSVFIAEITGKKTIMSEHLLIALERENIKTNNEPIFQELSKGTIKRLVQQYYLNRISDKYIEALINQIEYEMYQIIYNISYICQLRGRKTVTPSDLNLYNQNLNKMNK